MTKRLSAGAMLAACAVLFTAFNAYAARPFAKEWVSKEDPYSRTSVPLFFRSSAGTTWLDVGQACSPADTANSNHTQSEVWCFEGANGDSSWPNVGTQGSRANPLFGDPGDWGHWSRYNPPLPAPSKWHITPRNVAAGTGGVYSAYCGCDSVGINPNCQEIGYWLFKEGYGNNWNYSLVLDMSGQDASSGGTIKFDALYDIECRYDYTYLEYFNSGTGQWQYVIGTGLRPGIFNAVSGNPDLNHGGTGRACPGDYLFNSDQKDLGSGPELYHGNAAWETNVTFPMPVIPPAAGGLILRWRAFTDVGWSDEDGRGDTDGMFQLDNVLVTFAATAVTVSDGFESGDFNGVVASSGAAQWTPGPLAGNPYDGWHLQFDPNYKNKGNTCTFSDDWMWAAKPATSSIPANGFDYILASPKVYCDGWTGGLVEWSNYLCAAEDREDYSNYLMRVYDSAAGEWSLWLDFGGPGTVWFGGCDFWNFNNTNVLTPYLGADVDSLQIGWELLDVNVPGDFEWGAHGGVQLLIDNVSIGEFDGTATVFTIGGTTQFSDTFSLTDQAHTQSLKNIEEGNWIATGGTRIASKDDSLQVQVTDYDGVTASNVTLFWRVGSGTPPTFMAWQNKPMILSEPDPTSTSDEGTYRAAIGGPSAPEDYNVGESGSATPPNLLTRDPIWTPGQTVEYYIRVVDNRVVGGPDTRYLPSTVSSTLGSTGYAYYFEILPSGRTTGGGEKICIVDAYQRTNVIDFENSDGFSATGGAGLGGFTTPAVSNPENLVERALVLMYGGTQNFDNTTQTYGSPKWDIYDVHGGGSSGIRHPRVVADDDIGLGGLASDLGAPRYDAVIWLTGTFDAYCYAETTRIELKTYLDNGGNLFSTGDEVAFFLGSGGQNADSTIQFLGDYLGISFPNATDDETADRTLSVQGVAGTSLAGVKLGLYGECPFRAKFDKMFEAPDVVGVKTSTTLATYQTGGVDPATDGRAAIIKNVRVASGGVAVHCGFDVSDLLSDVSRACLLDKVFTTDFGMLATSFTGCVQNGVDAPVVANSRFGFDLASASPNPFSEATSIHFSVPSRTHVSIEVYNILGQRVRTLVDETMEANSYVREWDGRADTGARVSSGIYFYKMVAGDFSATRKAVMLK